jgi:hypothetical protein
VIDRLFEKVGEICSKTSREKEEVSAIIEKNNKTDRKRV